MLSEALADTTCSVKLFFSLTNQEYTCGYINLLRSVGLHVSESARTQSHLWYTSCEFYLGIGVQEHPWETHTESGRVCWLEIRFSLMPWFFCIPNPSCPLPLPRNIPASSHAQPQLISKGAKCMRQMAWIKDFCATEAAINRKTILCSCYEASLITSNSFLFRIHK